jgi:hypothetical protein
MELKAWNIHVSTFNPATHRTPIITGTVTSLIQLWKEMTPEQQEEYGESFMVNESALAMLDGATWDPKVVVNKIEDAISAYQPQAQYLVGMDALMFIPIIRMLPTWLVGTAGNILPTPARLTHKERSKT